MTPECILACADILGEVPIWDKDNSRICWLDVSRARLQTLDVTSGMHQIHQLPGNTAGGWALRAGGGAIVALDNGLFGLTDTEIGPLVAEIPARSLQASHRVNETAVDSAGQLWAGVMERSASGPSGGLFRVGPSGAVHQALGGITTPNGLCFDPTGTTLYFADSARKLIWSFAFDAEQGLVDERRVFCDLSSEPGKPDGAAIDAEGYMWSAGFGAGRILRIDPYGRITHSISLPVSKVTSLAFGGPDLRTLYITTASGKLTPEELAAQPLAGGLFSMTVDVAGILPGMFAG
ncbi:SMP-30/gluconolactonase/LRE family protein [Pelagibacterium limicola]|uniref:SMP-30/gluconolactonase/LRE family protein n=1 Tax=Pelagibacterium limicola TaxID=2791022 RepID=UPI0018B006A6